MNSVVLIGRLVRDPELRFTPSGKAVATFSLAVNRAFSKNKEADFFRIVVWGKSAENCANYLAKGRLAGVQGRLQSSSYDTKNGKRYVTEVVADQVEFLEWGERSQVTSTSQPYTPYDFNPDDIDMNHIHPMPGDDEDIPF